VLHFARDGLTFDVTDTAPAAGRDTGEVALLLHGFPEDRHSWAAVTPALAAAGFRVLAPEQRGYSAGARPTSRRAYTLARLAGDVLALADAAGADRFHLVGHDWGAGVAWYLAHRHPDRIISLAALSVPHPNAVARAFVRSDQALRSWYMAVFQIPGLAEWVLSRGGGRVLRDSLIRSGLDAADAGRYAVRAADRAAMRGPINWYRAVPLAAGDRIGPVGVPTLFVWGDRDRYVSRAAAEACRDFVTGPYRFEVFRGVSHWLLQETPERVAGLLAGHFADASPA
jgi:pimeloyl-ACP methyl ester carboxylesterase